MLREAQKVSMRKGDEKLKAQARVLVVAVRETQKQEQAQNPGKPTQA